METFLTDPGNEASAQVGLHQNQYTFPKIHRLSIGGAHSSRRLCTARPSLKHGADRTGLTESAYKVVVIAHTGKRVKEEPVAN